MSRLQFSLIFLLLLGACSSGRTPAPIVVRPLPGTKPVPTVTKPAVTAALGVAVVKPVAVEAEPTTYIVKKGDGLYRIALDHGLAYRELADWNNIVNVDEIKVDQVLRLTPPDNPAGVEVRPLRDANGALPVQVIAPATPVTTLAYPKALKLPYGTQIAETLAKQAEGAVANTVTVASKPATVPASRPTSGSVSSISVKTPEKSTDNEVVAVKNGGENGVDWLPPTVGKLLRPYSVESKGVDLSGKLGQPVVASESGKVVYAGSGLRGYGKMVIIKHNNAYLSAYAHNDKVVVKEGDAVKRGEKIAEMGNSDTDQVKLHFEIRKFGKPVDPTKFITADRP